MEKVSILMPIYNVEKYLSECIDSVLAQTYKNFELIMVDDGSPDNCGKIIDEYANIDDRIVAIHQKNCGVDFARNNAIEHANGKYIAFIDSDDTYETEFIEKLVYAIEHDKSDMAVCSFIPFGVDNLPKFKIISKGIIDGCTGMKFALGYNSVNGYVWNKMFKREIIEREHIRFEKGYLSCEDILFTGNYMFFCEKISILDDALYHYRQVKFGANRVRYSGVKFDNKWMSSFKMTKYFRNQYKNSEVDLACNLHDVREASIVLRSIVSSNYKGKESRELQKIIRKYAFRFIMDKNSSYYQKISVLLTFISPKLEYKVWKFLNKV